MFESSSNDPGLFEVGEVPVCTPPYFPAGEEALQKWVAGNFDYPKKRNKAVIKDRTLLTITLSATGTVERVEKVFPREEGCAKDYETRLKTMPAWTPAIKDGKPVSGEVNILINCY
jgi:hypothetical protein